jgi:hypothetical protein
MPAGGQQRRIMQAARRARRASTGRRGATVGNLLDILPWSTPLGWWSDLGRRGRLLAALASTMAIAVLCLVLVLVAGSGPQLRARQYLAFTACLLTDANGVTRPPAASAWAGMEDASLATHAKVEYQPVMAGGTEGAAQPVLASLVIQQCRVIVATGQAPVAAVVADARQYPSVRFAVISLGTAGGSKVGGPNVTVIAGSASTVRSAVDGLIKNAVSAS